ncbi:MAG TPA: hypothetical protein VF165_08325 [Nocardioidaceae bacterium]
MFDVIVEGTALGWVDDGSFPVSVKVALNDVDGKVHHIIEKEPVLVSVPMALDMEFPVRLGVRGSCIRADEQTVEVRLAYDVVTTDGASTLTFGVDDVHWM